MTDNDQLNRRCSMSDRPVAEQMGEESLYFGYRITAADREHAEELLQALHHYPESSMLLLGEHSDACAPPSVGCLACLA